eukprot:m.4378 g.4378  ORF g.4378 m.4378 type:complete len:86 (+) comp2970_c0_seq1:125-382(+)
MALSGLRVNVVPLQRALSLIGRNKQTSSKMLTPGTRETGQMKFDQHQTNTTHKTQQTWSEYGSTEKFIPLRPKYIIEGYFQKYKM